MNAISFWDTKCQLWRQEKGGTPRTHEKKSHLPDLDQTGNRMGALTGALSHLAGINLQSVIPFQNTSWCHWMTLSILQAGMRSLALSSSHLANAAADSSTYHTCGMQVIEQGCSIWQAGAGWLLPKRLWIIGRLAPLAPTAIPKFNRWNSCGGNECTRVGEGLLHGLWKLQKIAHQKVEVDFLP